MRPKPTALVILLALTAAAAAPAATPLVSYPGVARLGGLNGTTWRTEAWLANPSVGPREVTLGVVPRGGGPAVTRALTLAPGEVRDVPDLHALLEAPDGAGTLSVVGEVQSWVRVFNDGPAGTYGMAVPAVRTPDLFEATDTILFPVHRPASVDSEPRSNLLLYNPGQAALTVALAADTARRDVTVPPNAYVQVTDLGSSLGLEPGTHLLRCTAPAAWYGYVAAVDPRSGDPTPVAGLPEDGGEPTVTFAGVAGLAGMNGTHWRSSLVLANHTAAPQPVQLLLIPRDSDTPVAAVEQTLPAGEVVVVDDIYEALEAPPGAGTLAVVGVAKTWVRTYNQSSSGTYGDAVPATGLYDLFEPGLEVAFALQVPADPATGARSNLLLFNPLQQPLALTIEAGGEPHTVTLPPLVYTQLTNAGAALGLEPGPHVVTVRANARWHAAVSTIDPRSGDPSTALPSRPVRPTHVATQHVEITDTGTHYEVMLDYSGGAAPRAVGEELGGAVTEILPNYGALADSLLAELVEQSGNAPLQAIQAQAAALLPQLDPAHREELEGFASKVADTATSALGDGRLSPAEAVLLSFVEDLTGTGACSAVSVFGPLSATGLPLTARLVDHSGNSLPEIQAVTVIATSSGGLVVNVGYLGFLGIATGVNQAGLMVGDLDSPTAPPPDDFTGLRATAFDMRHALEHETTVAGAGAWLGRADHRYSASRAFILSDVTESRVLENDLTSTGPLARTLRGPDSPLNPGVEWGIANAVASVNSFVLLGNTDNHTGTDYNVGRWASFRSGLEAAGSEVTVEELEAIASYHANPGLYPWTPADVYNLVTQQIVVFDPAAATLDVAFHPRQGWLRATPRFVRLQLDE